MDGAKQLLRREFQRALAELKRDELMKKSRQLSQLLNELMQKWQNLIWGVFSPLPQEPQWQLEIAGLTNFKLAWPKYKAPGEMKFLQCHPKELQKSTEFGIEMLCPSEKNPPVSPQALLVPALGFTTAGERIGRGGGHYDRVLEKFKGLKIGICFREQIRHHLPIAEHDEKVQMVVTDGQIIRCTT